MMSNIRTYTDNLSKNWPILVSALAFVGFMAVAGSIFAAVIVAVAALTFACLYKKPDESPVKSAPMAVLIIACLCDGALAYELLGHTADNKALTAAIGNSATVRFIIAAVFMLVSMYSAIYFVSLIYSRVRTNPLATEEEDGKITRRRYMLMSFVTATVVIGLVSKSSPLYPYNDWVDPNCFVTVGKSMIDGLVPYLDLYEQKGPLLYILHAFASLISRTGFFGPYLLEVIASAFFLYFGQLSVSLYSKKPSVFWIPAIASVTYSALSFCQGDSAEELCLPFLSYSLYCGLKAMKSRTLPSFKECFAVGATGACVLWIKYNMLGFYIGWFLAFAVVSLESKAVFSLLIKRLGAILLGVFAVSLPILIYFLLNGALDDLYEAYFYNNMTLYSESQNEEANGKLLENLKLGFEKMKSYAALSIVAMIMTLSKLLSDRRYRETLLVLGSFAGLFVFVFFGGADHRYYSFIFMAFIPLAFTVICQLEGLIRGTTGRSKALGTVLGLMISVLSVYWAFSACDNTYLMEYDKEDLPQYQFAQIINTKKDATLLNYHFLDGGFYNVADITPTCKYFCELNIPLEEMIPTQTKMITDGSVDFVVTENRELKHKNYQLVKEVSFFSASGSRKNTWRLYQLKEGK